MLAFDPERRQRQKIFATGLRNCSGMTIQPATGQLWCVVNERDELGDNVPFDYATHVEEGAFYGWPWYYIGDHEDPAPQGRAARSRRQGDDPRRADPGPFGAAQHRLLRRRRISRPSTRAMPSSRCTAHGTAASAPATRSSACIFERRQADRRIRGLHDRLRHLRRARSGAVRSASRSPRTARCSSPRTATARSGG